MNVSDQDRAAGFKDIRVVMLNEKFEIVRVSAPLRENLVEIMGQKKSAKMVYGFVRMVTGKNLEFVLQMSPESLAEIFITASGLIGAKDLAREEAVKAGQNLIQRATHVS